MASGSAWRPKLALPDGTDVGEDHLRVMPLAAPFAVAAVVDARLDWRRATGPFVSLVVTNVLDRTYAEVPGVPLAGTLATLTAGISY